jgi:3-oxoacyl-(acyl-carrier-protein) synthase
MNRVYIGGVGAVSPAGWDVAALRLALQNEEPLPIRPLERPGWDKPLQARFVPPPAPPPAFLKHPRLRRASPLTHYAAAAALEATARIRPTAGSVRFGVVMSLQAGCVQYSHRFFQETVQDPATASPLLFPETVFAAPASHVAALLGRAPLVCTVTGDPAAYLQAMAIGIQWLEEERVDFCLVIGAEEMDWLLADALWHLEHAAVMSVGAGALCLTLDARRSIGVELAAITDPHTYSSRQERPRAAQAMRAQLPPGSPGELLCDGLTGNPRADAAESAAWRGWPGPRLSPKRVLGEGLMAAGAWQCVAACDVVASGRVAAAHVSLVGSNQQAIGARFVGVEG